MALNCETNGERDTSLPAAIARLTGTQPTLRVGLASEGRLCAAIWRFRRTARPISLTHPTTSVLCFHRAGTPLISRVVEGKRVRKRPRIGSVTFAPKGVRASWESDGPCEQVHVYVDTRAVETFVAQHLDLSSAPEIDDFFAVSDPWLAGYFQMLIGEYDLLCERCRVSDTLLLDQTGCVLVRHLVRWHSNATPRSRGELDRQTQVSPLRPLLTRRVQEFVDANLAEDLHLNTLADLTFMSVDHFLRSFRAATGTTPYHYVLEQRLRRASRMLIESGDPIGRIAASCGFSSASHFSAAFRANFGITPSRFRKERSAA